MKKNLRLLLRALAFLIVMGLAVWHLQGIFGLNVIRSFEHEKAYLWEDDDSMDAVYIGGSDVHAFWQPLFGWNDQGIAVWNYTLDNLPSAAVKYLVIEARKTQPDALMIISLSTFKKDTAGGDMVDLHRIVDYMPFSMNKVRLINHLTEGTEYSGFKSLEFYLPIIRFHTRWSSLEPWSFGILEPDYKGSMYSDAFQSLINDQRTRFTVSEERTELPEDVAAAMTDLLDYCDKEKVRVLFVKSPQGAAQDAQARMNTLEDMVTSRGYPCLDLLEHLDELGIDLRYDFYNKNHTNVHGSLKFSHYLGKYLVEQYGFRDKRGSSGWESWDKAAEEYMAFLAPYILPLEAVPGGRDPDLALPKLSDPVVDGTSVTLTWAASEGAESYEIYRLAPKGKQWSLMAEVDGSVLTWTDSGLVKSASYRYTVVPCRQTSDGKVYGHFYVPGVSAETGG